ncbi:MAG: DUF4258 domain-containing protein [Fischerella sp.]|nr:DUF4258 domain-containing protein [Fischerella sp.]
MDIKDIINALNTGKVIKSRHSISEALADPLNIEEIYFSVEQGGEIIEDYPDAYPLPACLRDGTQQVNLFIVFGHTIKLTKQ